MGSAPAQAEVPPHSGFAGGGPPVTGEEAGASEESSEICSAPERPLRFFDPFSGDRRASSDAGALCSGVTGGGALPSGSPLSWRFSGRLRVLGPGRRSRVCMRDADGQRVVGLAKARWRAHGSSNSTMALVAVHSIKRTPVGTRFAMSSSSDRKMRQQKASCSHGKSSSAHSPPNAPPAAPIALR